MRKVTSILAIAAFAVGTAACTSGASPARPAATPSPDARPVFFAPERADELAHAAMLDADALPGEGWRAVARDSFGKDAQALATAFQQQPACDGLDVLRPLSSLFGAPGAADERPIGQAKVEFTQFTGRTLVPTSVETEVAIEETAAAVEATQSQVRQALESGQAQRCLLAVLSAGSGQETGSDDRIDFTPRNASAAAPAGGVAMAYDIHMEVEGVGVDMALELYAWARGNARVSTLFAGEPDQVNAAFTGAVLRSFDQKVVDTGTSGGAAAASSAST
ncbi:MAG TPA: hypothetical protein VFY79_03975 [Dehalococcoidia bacterium]|nr:hypothetical protein [Dehalococcoidia bacterium]